MQTIAIVLAVLTIVADNILGIEYPNKFKSTTLTHCSPFLADNCDTTPQNDEARLRNHLMCKYDRDYLPVPDGEAVEVVIFFHAELFEYVSVANRYTPRILDPLHCSLGYACACLD